MIKKLLKNLSFNAGEKIDTSALEQLKLSNEDLLKHVLEMKTSMDKTKTASEVNHAKKIEEMNAIKFLVEQFTGLMNYNVAQSQAILNLHRKLVQVDAFVKEVMVTLDLSIEEEEELQLLLEKYQLLEDARTGDATLSYQ